MIPAIIERCAGIDVGKKFVAVCVMTGPANGEAQITIRKFGTVRHELEALRTTESEKNPSAPEARSRRRSVPRRKSKSP
jgi:hypothetical protein